MEVEKLLGIVILGWLIGAVLLMARLIRRGQKLITLLATRYPETYEALGRPRPGFLQSARRRQFSQFLSRRTYENIGDPVLSAQFEEYRKAEVRLLILLLVSLVIVALVVLTVRHAT